MKNTLFLVLFSIFLSACSSSANEDVVPFQEQVNDTFDTDVYIPHLQDYSITSAIIETGPFGKHKDLIIKYSKQLGNKKDEEYIEKYEENMGSEVLYGIYGGEPLVFKLTFNDGKQSSSPSNTKMVNDTEVEYHKIENKNVLFVIFNLDSGTYSGEFHLTEISEERAYEIVEQIIRVAK